MDHKFLVWVCMFLLSAMGARLGHSQNEAATETSVTPVTEVRLLTSLMDGREQGDKEIAVQETAVQETVLDLETGNAALQVVSWKHTQGGSEIVAVVPFMQDLKSSQATKLASGKIARGKIASGLRSEAPQTLNRQLAATVYKEFGRDVYWSKHLEKLPPDAHGKFDRERFELIGFKELKGKRIVDADGDPIGSLVDMGMDVETGLIVYCVVQSEDGSRRAIPLGAFVNRDPKKDWKIELESAQVMLFTPFTDEKPPQQIDRGWQEYVAVRYGRNALRTETKGDLNREKVKDEKKTRDR